MSKYNQTITLWKHTGLDRSGVPTYSAPVTYQVRFEKQDRVIIDSEGREIRGSGVIYFETKVFDIGDYIAEGVYTELLPIKGSYEIKNERSISNLSGTQWEYRALV